MSAARAKQIAELRRFVPSAVQRGTTPFEYWDVGIEDRRTRKVYTMRINLPHNFPAAGPVMQVLHRVGHRILDGNCVVQLASLDRWNGASMSLGRVVAEAIETFGRAPLVPMNGPPPTFFTFPPPQQAPPRGAYPGTNPYAPRGAYPRGLGPGAYPAARGPGPAYPRGPAPRGPGPRPGAAYPRGPAPRGPAPGRGAPVYPRGPRGGPPPPYNPSGPPPPYSGGAGAGAGAGASGAGPARHPRRSGAAEPGTSLDAEIRAKIEALKKSRPMPKPPTEFPRLNSLEPTVLAVMKSDPSELKQFLDTVPDVLTFTQAAYSELAETHSRNKARASQSLAKEAEFKRLKDEVAQLTALVDGKRRVLARENAKRAKALRTLHKPEEAKCRELYEEFVEDESRATSQSLRTFTQKYLKHRTKYHKTKAMVMRYFVTHPQQ